MERSLDIYLEALEPHSHYQVAAKQLSQPRLLKIGELARQAEESVSTIRYWTKEGLLDVASHTTGGYSLYDPMMVERAREIRRMQQERLTIAEIREALAVRMAQ